MKLVVANLKMNLDYNSVLEYSKNVNKNIIVCPSYIFIPYFLNGKVGAQDCFIYDEGAYTGNVSPLHLKQMGVEYVIIGHSERRNIEDDNLINQKIKAAIRNGLKVILCIGEGLNEDKNLKLLNQITLDLNDIPLDNVIIAYEPIWAISSFVDSNGQKKEPGVIPTNEQIEDSIILIKETIKNKFNKNIEVLYGGSVDPQNISILKEIRSLDGVLVGKASIDYNKVNEIYEILNFDNI